MSNSTVHAASIQSDCKLSSIDNLPDRALASHRCRAAQVRTPEPRRCDLVPTWLCLRVQVAKIAPDSLSHDLSETLFCIQGLAVTVVA